MPVKQSEVAAYQADLIAAGQLQSFSIEQLDGLAREKVELLELCAAKVNGARKVVRK